MHPQSDAAQTSAGSATGPVEDALLARLTECPFGGSATGSVEDALLDQLSEWG